MRAKAANVPNASEFLRWHYFLTDTLTNTGRMSCAMKQSAIIIFPQGHCDIGKAANLLRYTSQIGD